MTAKIGLIGCGPWGRLILRDLVACGAEVAVVCRSDASRANAAAYGASSIQSEHDPLPEVDGYVVATKSTTHAAMIERLLPTGRPIFTEKPMTTDVASARRLVAAAGDRLRVMDKWRYHPGVEAMRREIVEGRVGEVLALRFQRWSWSVPHADTTGLWILGPHDLAITQHLIGEIPPLRSVVAIRRQEPDLGLTAHLGGDELPSVTLSLGVVSPSHRRHCLVVGTRATMELRGGYETNVYVREGAPGQPGARERTIEVGSEMPLLLELRAFIGWLGGGPAPLSSAAEGLATVERVAQIEAELLEQAKR